jgi:Fur family ferric uptake transcriptional regulator
MVAAVGSDAADGRDAALGPDAAGADWRADLRRRGYRLTVQRELVLDAVRSLEHATPEAIHARLEAAGTGVNLSTVYRTLEVLESLGLVSHAHLGHGPTTFHAAAALHVHVVCRACGAVADVDAGVASELVAQLDAEHDFAVDLPHLSVVGRCGDCRRAADG